MAVSFLEQYNLTKEDWDNIIELCKLPGKPDLLALIPPKVCIQVKDNTVYTLIRNLDTFLILL